MGHFIYPSGTPVGMVPFGYVIPSSEWELVIQQLFKAANFDDGGTWAPGSFVTVGGAGFQLTGTGHTVAASARLNIAAGGEIRLTDTASGITVPMIRVNGSGGDIWIWVNSHVSTIEFRSGSLLKLNAGAAFDAYGAVTFKATGSGFTVETGLTATWSSGSTLLIASGATMNVSGDLAVKNGGTLTCENLSNFTGSSTAFAQWAGEWWFAGLAKFVASTWPKLDPARSWRRFATSIAMVSYNNHAGTGPDNPDAWFALSNLSTAPCLRTASAAASGDFTLLEFTDLPDGGTLTSVEVDSRGGNSTLPTYPKYRIVRWKTGQSGLTDLSAVTDDTHSNDSNWDSAVETTTITPLVSHTIDKTYRYGLLINHPYAVLGSYMRVFRVEMIGTATELRL